MTSSILKPRSSVKNSSDLRTRLILTSDSPIPPQDIPNRPWTHTLRIDTSTLAQQSMDIPYFSPFFFLCCRLSILLCDVTLQTKTRSLLFIGFSTITGFRRCEVNRSLFCFLAPYQELDARVESSSSYYVAFFFLHFSSAVWPSKKTFL